MDGLRVLITNHTLGNRAGTELYVRDLATALLARGHHPIAYSPQLGEVAGELRRATIPVISDLNVLSKPPDIIHGHHHLPTMTALLHFPETPAISYCHGWLPKEEAPARSPRIYQYIAVDNTCRDRLIYEHGIPAEKIRLLLNFVDLQRFQPRSSLPLRPKRALVFSNQAGANSHLEVIREACRKAGIELDVLGLKNGNVSDRPEQELLKYDLVFAKARAALEALASGTAVILCDAVGAGPMVTAQELNRLRPLNFGIRALQNPLEVEYLLSQINRYDSHDAAEVTQKIRESAGREVVVDELVSLYEEVIITHQKAEPVDRIEELKQTASYLHWMNPQIEVRSVPDSTNTKKAFENNPAILEELTVVKNELEIIHAARVWQLVQWWWRFRVHLRTLNPFDWLKHQQFYWRFRTSIKRRVARILPAFLKRTLKATRFYARQEFFQPKLSKPVNAIPSLLPQEFQSLAIYPELSANHQFEKSETKIHPSKIDIIAYSVIDWETRYQRPQQIMAQFAAQGHRIFYLSTSRFLPPDTKAKFAVREICPNVFEVSVAAHRVPNVYGEVMDGENQKVMMESLQELRRLYRIDEAVNYVMLASWGSLALATQQEWGWQTLYDCMDEWATFPGIKPALLEMELKLVQESDLIVVTAQRLFDKWKKYERPMVLARNAVDYDFYQGRCQPNPLLPEVKNPVIGYYGAIADWFDVELMAFVAAQRPDYTFVLLGGVFDIDVSVLQVLPNVRLLGHQLYETMPQYLYHFDACIIPFKINAVTEATDPVKLYEYLSGGKPVVAVAMPELENYRDHIYIARDREDFPVQLDRALCEDNAALAAQRRALAQKHTWKNRQEIIEAGLIEVTPKASIIIVTWHNLAMTKLCIESLLRNTNYLNYEIIVVDNNSEDGTPDYLQTVTHEHSHVKIILNATNYGFAKANNQGIEISSGEHIVLLNNDTIVPRGWLSRLLHHLGDPEIGIVGPMTNAIGNEAKIEVPYRTWSEMEDFAAAHVAAHHLQIADIKMLAMYCVAFRRETYEKIGPLDEQYGIGMFEDDDYSERIKAAGLRVVCAADVFVHHFGQASFKKLIANGAYNPLFEENRRRFEVKWQRAWVAHKHATLSYRIHHIPEHF